MLKWASLAGIAGAIIAAAALAATGTQAERLALVAFLTMAHFCFSYVLGQYAGTRPEYAPAGWLFLFASGVAATGLFIRVATLGSAGGAGLSGGAIETVTQLALSGGGMLGLLGWTWIAVIAVPRWLRSEAPAQSS